MTEPFLAIDQEIAELQKQEEELAKKKTGVVEEAIEQAKLDEALKDEPQAEEEAEEIADEIPEEEPEDEKAKKSSYAKMRIKAREAEETARAERERAAALERKLLELAEEKGKLSGKIEATQKKEPEDAEPDRNFQPDEWIDWKARQIEKRLEQTERLAQESRMQAAVMQAKTAMQNLEDEFAAEHSDYHAAKKALIETQAAITALARGITPQQAKQIVEQDILVTSSQLAAQGKNPIDIIYQAGKTVYRPAAKEEAKEEAPKRDNAAALDAQRRSASLVGKGSGSAGKQKMDVQKILEESSIADIMFLDESKLLG